MRQVDTKTRHLMIFKFSNKKMILNKKIFRTEYAGLGSQRLMSLDMYTTKHINRLKCTQRWASIRINNLTLFRMLAPYIVLFKLSWKDKERTRPCDWYSFCCQLLHMGTVILVYQAFCRELPIQKTFLIERNGNF